MIIHLYLEYTITPKAKIHLFGKLTPGKLIKSLISALNTNDGETFRFLDMKVIEEDKDETLP